MDELLTWACAEGMQPPPLQPAYFESTRCRGMKSTRSIAEGEVVLEIPSHLLLSADSAMECRFVREVVKAASQEDEQLCERQLLSLHLLVEKWKAERSRWWRFIRSIPPSYDTLENWSEQSVARLQYKPFLAIAARRKRVVNDEFSQLQRLLSRCKKRSWNEPEAAEEAERIQLGFSSFSREDYLWAAGTVSTRSCHYERKSGYSLRGETVGCLVPVLDFLNHSTAPVAACGFCKDAMVYRVTCLRSYEEGEQVMIHYGNWSNAGLLEHYGFVLEDNPLDSCMLWLRHPPNPPEHLIATPTLKSEFRRMQDMIISFGKEVEEDGTNSRAPRMGETKAASWLEFELYAGDEGAPAELSWNILTFLRWSAYLANGIYDASFFDKLLEADEDSPVSLQNETEALQMLEKSLQNVLSTLAITDGDEANKCGNDHDRIAVTLKKQAGKIIMKHMSWLRLRHIELENEKQKDCK